ncbi:ATP-binding SpoIIE family protein phosphatase [Pontibacter ruber]|uniref:ATP-binding SpoIIE family protein phosphatase n=1 Tax=Pontibacter ruber TaxID=1343895 RepID=A0ABW5CWJ7_9BACT|nr:ATP-binding SpoIIE family protein phosphatase [Pontibacter ruber]
MDVNHHQRYTLPDRSFANILKRDIARLAEGLGFSASEVGKINIIVSEMASNLVKHSPQGGELLVKTIGEKASALEIICLDNGPGMSEPRRMMQDGISTTGTAGEGLGAIKRQSDEFDLYSQPGSGTIILSRVHRAAGQVHPPQRQSRFETGVVMVPKPGEQLCGDGYAIIEEGNNLYLIALDGLGHGANANEASQLAAQVFQSNYKSDLPVNLRLIHTLIRRTRGAVGSIAHINVARNQISYCGVGNIAGKIFCPEGGKQATTCRNIISYNGILGHNIPTTLNNQVAEWNNSRTLVLHSDGLRSRWDLNKYPGILNHDPTTIAAVLFKEFSRQTDDTLVMVVRNKV